jgi:hypothetical protein
MFFRAAAAVVAACQSVVFPIPGSPSKTSARSSRSSLASSLSIAASSRSRPMTGA